MLHNPSKALAVLRKQGMLLPQSPGFRSPWEQMAFSGGGMLGKGVGNQFGIVPQMKEMQEAAAAANTKTKSAYQEALANEDKAVGFTSAGDIAMQSGDQKAANKFYKLAQSERKQRGIQDNRDAKYSQWATKMNFDMNKFSATQEHRANVLARGKDKDTRTYIDKLMDGAGKLDEAITGGTPEEAKVAQMVKDKVFKVMKAPSAFPTGTELKQTDDWLAEATLTQGDKDLDLSTMPKKHRKALAVLVAADVKQRVNAAGANADLNAIRDEVLASYSSSLTDTSWLGGSWLSSQSVEFKPRAKAKGTIKRETKKIKPTHSMVGDDGKVYYYDAEGNEIKDI